MPCPKNTVSWGSCGNLPAKPATLAPNSLNAEALHGLIFFANAAFGAPERPRARNLILQAAKRVLRFT